MLYGGLFETVLFLFELFQTISCLFFGRQGARVGEVHEFVS